MIRDGGFASAGVILCVEPVNIVRANTRRDSHSGKKGENENNMSSRSALPSGNDRSTGDHVSAITAWAPALVSVCVHAHTSRIS